MNPMKPFKYSNIIKFLSQAPHAFSLVEAMIGITLISIAAIGMVTVFGGRFSGMGRARDELDLQNFREEIESKLDCVKTLGSTFPYTCPAAGTFMDLKNSNTTSNVIVSGTIASPSRRGNWALRARCDQPNGELIVEASKLKSGKFLNSTTASDYLTDSFSNIPFDWNHPMSRLYAQGAGLCKEHFNLDKNFCPARPGSTALISFSGSCPRDALGMWTRPVGYDPQKKALCCAQTDRYITGSIWTNLTPIDSNCNTSTILSIGPSVGWSVWYYRCHLAANARCQAFHYTSGHVQQFDDVTDLVGFHCYGLVYP
jgi:type II secretory pathway pseudopilin PulG